MKRSLAITLAVGVVTLGGATSGALIGKSPMLQRGDDREAVPQPDFAYAEPTGTAEAGRATPNHYPIVTPEGRFEVHELRARGVMRNRHTSHYDRIYAQERMALEAGYPAPDYQPYEPDPAFAEAEWRRAGGQSATSTPSPAAARDADRPATITVISPPRSATVTVISPPRPAPRQAGASQAALTRAAPRNRPEVEANSGIY